MLAYLLSTLVEFMPKARPQALPEAGVQRTLETVRSMPLFGSVSVHWHLLCRMSPLYQLWLGALTQRLSLGMTETLWGALPLDGVALQTRRVVCPFALAPQTLDQHFLHKEFLMPWGIVVEGAKDLISQGLIKRPGLKAERIEMRRGAATLFGRVFHGGHQLLTIATAP